MAFLVRLDGPILPPRFPEIRWFASGVPGLEFSGVGIGVTSVEVPLSYKGFGWPDQDSILVIQARKTDHTCLPESSPGIGGGAS